MLLNNIDNVWSLLNKPFNLGFTQRKKTWIGPATLTTKPIMYRIRLHQGKKSRLKIFKSRESDHMNPAKLYCVASTLHSLRKKSVKSLDAFELIDDTAVRIIVSSTTDKCLLGLVMILDTTRKMNFPVRISEI